MKGPVYNLNPDRPAAGHGWAITVAVVLSIAVHVFLLYRFGEALLSPAATLRGAQLERVSRERREAVRVDRFDPDPLADVDLTRRPLSEWTDVSAEALRAALPVGIAAGSLTPPSIFEDVFRGDTAPREIQSPDAHPAPAPWQPRQIIQEISDRRVPDALAMLPRREIPRIERVGRAPDYVAPFDLHQQRFVPSDAALPFPPPDREWRELAQSSPPGAGPEPDPTDAGQVRIDEQAVSERIDPVTAVPYPEPPEYEAVEHFLSARTLVYREGPDPKRIYFRIEVSRRDADVLPPIPKDVIFIQDASASIAEQRLFFCRQGLIEALEALEPEDRFNVMAFSDSVQRAFPDWQSPTSEAKQTARDFIGALRSEGETDLFASMQELLNLTRQPGRPVIAIVITDGRPTVGLTASSDIIGEFSRLNQGKLSVFTLGTQDRVNTYLLDMLSYCNRGDVTPIRGGRWAIPDFIGQIMQRTRRPLLDNLRFRFDDASQAEVYPELSANLYADQPLVFHGSCPAGTANLVFQARGTSPGVNADMLYVIDLANAPVTRDASIREQWAQQKLYALTARYTRDRSRSIRNEMRRLERQYRIALPYADAL